MQQGSQPQHALRTHIGNIRKRKGLWRRELTEKEKETAGWWTATVSIGLLVGLTEYVLTLFLASIVGWRYSNMQKLITSNGLFLAGCFASGTAIGFVLLAAMLVKFVAPIASGSGLPEMKGFLNANRIPALFRFSTFSVRILGVCFGVTAGLPIGQLGPMVHIGGCIGYWISALYHRTIGKQIARNRHAFPAVEEEISKDVTRLFVTLGGAAGIAAAFKAPVGGVLYMFEELASFWSPETTFRAFVCTTTASISLSVLLSQGASVTYESLSFFLDSSLPRANWSTADLLPIILLSLICGVTASLFTKLLLAVMKLRRTSKRLQQRPWLKIVDATVVALIVSVWKFYFPLVRNCSNEVIQLSFRYNCDEHQSNSVATVFFSGAEGILKLLFDTSDMRDRSNVDLIVLFLTVMICACLLADLPIPMGLFVPNMLLGAAAGRMVGQIASRAHVTALAHPGFYAVIGAGAMLGGFTRMTITVAVLLVEATGDLSNLAPMMLAISIAKLVAQSLVPQLDYVLLGMKAIPFLETDTPEQFSAKIAADVVQNVPQVYERSSLVLLQKALNDCPSCDAFPVVSTDQRLRGLVRREVLKYCLNVASEKDVMRIRKLFDDHTLELPISSSVRPGFTPRQFASRVREHGALAARLRDVPDLAEDGSIGVAIHYYMDHAPYTCTGDMPLRRVYALLRKLNLHHVVVLDTDCVVLGTICRADLLRVQHYSGQKQAPRQDPWLHGYQMFKQFKGRGHARRITPMGVPWLPSTPTKATTIDTIPDLETGIEMIPTMSSHTIVCDATMLDLEEGKSDTCPHSEVLEHTENILLNQEPVARDMLPSSPILSEEQGPRPRTPSPGSLRYENSLTFGAQQDVDRRYSDLRHMFQELLQPQGADAEEKKEDPAIDADAQQELESEICCDRQLEA